MTKEEAIKILKEIDYPVNGDNKEYRDMVFDMAIKALEQESKSEWEQDHAILKAYSDGVNEVLDKIRAEIESYKLSEVELSDMDEDSVKWGMKIAYDIVDKYKTESKG